MDSESILKEGYIGVSFFFILSGFILAYNYRDSMLNQRYQNLIFISPELPESTLHLLTLLIAVPLTIQNVDFNLLFGLNSCFLI
jgi:hypothetical protein